MTTAQWANIDDDAGAIHALLQRVAEHVAVEQIDHLWIFPARRIAVGESIVIIISAFEPADAQRRRVITAHFTISRNRKGLARVEVRFDEHASAPEDAVPRVVDGVLRRLGEEVGAEPREDSVSGDAERWAALIAELGGSPAAAPPDPTPSD